MQKVSKCDLSMISKATFNIKQIWSILGQDIIENEVKNITIKVLKN